MFGISAPSVSTAVEKVAEIKSRWCIRKPHTAVYKNREFPLLERLHQGTSFSGRRPRVNISRIDTRLTKGLCEVVYMRKIHTEDQCRLSFSRAVEPCLQEELVDRRRVDDMRETGGVEVPSARIDGDLAEVDVRAHAGELNVT